MRLVIRFEKDSSIVNRFRSAAKSEGWALVNGLKEWASKEYNATLRSNIYGDWTSITFKTEQDLNRFIQRFRVEE